MAEKKSFWSSMAGIVTGLAAVVTGLATLSGFFLASHKSSPTTASTPSAPATVSPTVTDTGSVPPASPEVTATDTAGSPQSTASGTPSPATGPGALTAAPDRLNLPTSGLGKTTPASTATITNPGPSTATIDDVRIQGPNAGAFTISGTTCGKGAQLAAGATCQVSVTFTPSTTGQASAALVLSFHPDAGSTLTVPLSATGSLL